MPTVHPWTAAKAARSLAPPRAVRGPDPSALRRVTEEPESKGISHNAQPSPELSCRSKERHAGHSDFVELTPIDGEFSRGASATRCNCLFSSAQYVVDRRHSFGIYRFIANKRYNPPPRPPRGAATVWPCEHSQAFRFRADVRHTARLGRHPFQRRPFKLETCP